MPTEIFNLTKLANGLPTADKVLLIGITTAKLDVYYKIVSTLSVAEKRNLTHEQLFPNSPATACHWRLMTDRTLLCTNGIQLQKEHTRDYINEMGEKSTSKLYGMHVDRIMDLFRYKDSSTKNITIESQNNQKPKMKYLLKNMVLIGITSPVSEFDDMSEDYNEETPDVKFVRREDLPDHLKRKVGMFEVQHSMIFPAKVGYANWRLDKFGNLLWTWGDRAQLQITKMELAENGYRVSNVLDLFEMLKSSKSWYNLFKTAEKTLYHGTTLENAKSIMEIGLVPDIGEFTKDAYYESIEGGIELPELSFATDKDDIRKAVTAMTAQVAKKLGKDFHSVTMLELKRYGAIVVFKGCKGSDEPASSFQHRPEKDKDWDMGYYQDDYPTVEPGDYFSEHCAKPDYYLTGDKMIQILNRINNIGTTYNFKKQQSINEEYKISVRKTPYSGIVLIGITDENLNIDYKDVSHNEDRYPYAFGHEKEFPQVKVSDDVARWRYIEGGLVIWTTGTRQQKVATQDWLKSHGYKIARWEFPFGEAR